MTCALAIDCVPALPGRWGGGGGGRINKCKFGLGSYPGQRKKCRRKRKYTNGTKKGINYIRRIPNWILKNIFAMC